MSSQTSPSRIGFLSLLALLLGLLSGGAAWVLTQMIALLTNVSLFGRVAWTFPDMSTLQVGPRVIIVAVAGGIAVAILALWSPIIKGHGIPETMEAVLTNDSKVSPRAAIAKPLSAAIAIGTGGPFGAEGPIIVTGGSIGSLAGQFLGLSGAERKILLACGAAGGMAGTFGAPLASVFLAIELLLFEFSSRSLIPLAISSAVAAAVHAGLFGNHPLFAVPAGAFMGAAALPLFIPLGLLCGVAAVLIAKGLFMVEAGFRRLPISDFWHPALGAFGFAVIALAVPDVLGVGYNVIEQILNGHFGLGALLVLGIAKLVAWWLALGSGTSGGTLAPILLVSAAFGGVIGNLAHLAFPGAAIDPQTFALVAMAAIFGAATRATITSIIFVIELTGRHEAVLPIMLASVLADLVSLRLLPEAIMTEKLSRRGLFVPTDMGIDSLTTHRVRDVMSSPVVTLELGTDAADALDALETSRHSAIPLVEAGKLCGIVSVRDLLDGDPDRIDQALAPRDVTTVRPGDSLRAALDLMVGAAVDHLPVVDGEGALLGICTRSDLLSAQAGKLREGTGF